MRSFTSSAIVAITICACQNVDNRGAVLAFSSPCGVTKSRPSSGSCDALHVSFSTISASLEPSSSVFESEFESSLKEHLTMTKAKTSKMSTKRLRKPRTMIRPKSLISSSAKIESPTTPSKKKKKKQGSIYPDLLSFEEEKQLTNDLRMLRTVVRIRDELTASFADIPELEEHDDLHSYPSEAQWAKACGLSVMQLRRIMHDGQEARSKLVSANGGLVTSIAKKHYYSLKHATEAGGGVGTILTLQDMIQEGNLGVMEAAERFDPERGFRFGTYATWWVRQRILKSISEYSRVIRLPAHVHTMLNKISRARQEMKQEIGRTPSDPELAHHLEIPVEKLQMYADSSRNVVSLELPVSTNGKMKDDRRTLGDKIASDSPTPEEDAEMDSLRRDIRAVINELAEDEQDVLVARFGLEDGTARNVEETSKTLGISRDRVRIVEARALNKLRHPHRNYKLKEYVAGNQDDDAEHELNQSPERIWSF